MALGRLKLLKAAPFLDESSADNDKAFKLLLESATVFVEKYCDRILEQAAISDERHTGKGTNKLFLREYPIASSPAIVVSIWDGSDSYDVENANYYELVGSRTLYYPKLGEAGNTTYGQWPKYENGIKVSYTAGYDTSGWDSLEIDGNFLVAEDLEYAVVKIAAYYWLEGRGSTVARLGLSGATIGPQSYDIETIMRSMDDPDVKEILLNYRRPRW